MVGGAPALQMDIVLAAGATVCPKEGVSTLLKGSFPHPYPDGTWRADIGPDSRVRLYVLDLPEGAVTLIMAISIAAPTARFEQVLEAAAPVVDSIEFQTP